MTATYFKGSLKTDNFEVTGATTQTGLFSVGSLAVGTDGTTLTKIKKYSQTITPTEVAIATAAEQTFTVTGLVTTDVVVVNPAATGNATAVASARVSAANTLAITFVNPTAGALTPGAGTYSILAFSV